MANENNRPHCQYARFEGEYFVDWPDNYPVPTLRTFAQLKREYDLTRKHYPNIRVIMHHSNQVLFCATAFHAFKINGQIWDCVNGWRKEILNAK